MHVRDRKDTLLDNPDLFLAHYFPHRVKGLKPFHLDLIRTAAYERRGLTLYAAAHGKTTIVSTLMPIWALCRDPNIRIAIIAKNDIDAKGIMTSIHAELAGNEMLLADFGPFKPDDSSGKPWALEKLSVDKRTRRGKEPTIAAFGAGAKTVLGHRTDWTICDDVVSERNASTPDQRAKLREWFSQCVMTMAEEYDDRITVVGTVFDPSDLYHDLVELSNPETGNPIWSSWRMDAIVDEEKHIVLWPEQHSWERLMESKAEMGTLDFNKRFRNIAVDKSRMAFREEWVKGGYIGGDQYPGCIDREHHVGAFDPGWRRVAGFDPAVGSSRHAKFCAHVTLASGMCDRHDKCLWVIDVHRDQWTLPQQAEKILDLHSEYDLQESRVETNAYQGGLEQLLDRYTEQRGVAPRISPHYTSRNNKPDPQIGIPGMAGWFEKGRVHIPWADGYSQRRMRILVDELIQYPGRTTDTVMAFWFAWRALEDSAPRFLSSNYLRSGNRTFYSKQRRVVRNPYYAR